MTMREWLNVGKAMQFVERDEFERALPPFPTTGHARHSWELFQANPVRWLSRAEDAHAEAIFAIAAKSVSR